MQLRRFLPYRVAVLAETVSRALAQVYETRHDLGRDEWRVLAALAEPGRLRSTDATLQTTLDKMQLSRACARLEARGLVVRSEDPADRRVRIVALTASGRTLVKALVPMVQAREAFLLDALDDEEREVLDRALAKLQARAEALERQG